MGCPNSKEEEPIEEPRKEAPPKKVDPRLPFATYRQFFNFRNSWKTVQRGMTPTAKEVLLNLFREHPEYKAMHKNLVKFETEESLLESQGFENVALDIFNTFDEVVECAEDKVDFAIATLTRVGKVHGKIPGFDPSYFKEFEKHFMVSVKNLFGDRWNDSTEENFKLFYDFVIKTMVDAMGTESNRI